MAAPASRADDLSSPRPDAVTPDGVYAGVVSRAIALGIDAALVQGSLLLLAALLGLVGTLVGGVHLGPAEQLIAAGLWVLATAAYFACCWAATGQTFGMQAMRLTVTTKPGQPADARPQLRPRCLARSVHPAGLRRLHPRCCSTVAAGACTTWWPGRSWCERSMPTS